ncbi:hypothetical protein CARUB_v10003059mg [Capsella rubella]|uniref:Uncharacterized protein n=1 Tax=Capsella rubella TaxID=81985 RepID=R0FC49_9BRAS|nr:hypothetical protein CARUB_v10003059mg [Capsella rubella]
MSIMKGAPWSMLVAILLACVVISNMNIAAAKVLSYRVIRRGDEPRCSFGVCPPKQEVYPYRRGCEKSHRCRGPGLYVPTKI